jgi:hypothetical protein
MAISSMPRFEPIFEEIALNEQKFDPDRVQPRKILIFAGIQLALCLFLVQKMRSGNRHPGQGTP